jgi:hypothetical protein
VADIGLLSLPIKEKGNLWKLDLVVSEALQVALKLKWAGNLMGPSFEHGTVEV